MEVTPERVQDTLEEVARWMTKEEASQKELQVLLGKLHFVCKCVRQGRVFVSQLQNLLREISKCGVVCVSEEDRADIRWFERFLLEYDKVTLIPAAKWSEPDIFMTDACRASCGSVCGNEYFRSEFLAKMSQTTLPISTLEMLTVVLAVRIWGHQMGRVKIRVYCYNDATVQVISSGKMRDAFMQHCLREVCYLIAKVQYVVWAVHLPGVQNRLPNLWSRWSLSAQVQDKFHELTAHCDMVQVYVNEQLFEFSHDW